MIDLTVEPCETCEGDGGFDRIDSWEDRIREWVPCSVCGGRGYEHPIHTDEAPTEPCPKHRCQCGVPLGKTPHRYIGCPLPCVTCGCLLPGRVPASVVRLVTEDHCQHPRWGDLTEPDECPDCGAGRPGNTNRKVRRVIGQAKVTAIESVPSQLTGFDVFVEDEPT